MRSKRTKEISFETGLDTALGLLKVQDRTVWELSTRLEAKGYPSSLVASVIGTLRERKVLDDDRVIERVIEQALAKPGTGRLKVKARLVSRGIDESVVDKALVSMPEDQQVRSALDTFVGKPFFEDQGKAYRHLANRGFEEEIIEAALSRYYRETGA